MAIEESLPLSTRLGPDTIREWEAAASRQWEDAETLRANGRWLAAIYLYGYVAEILIKGAYFRLDKSLDFEIGFADRNEAISRWKPRPSPHDIAVWANLLVEKRIDLRRPNDDPPGAEIINNATILYLHWRETIRYHATLVQRSELDQIRELTLWFRDNYPRL